MQRQQENDPLVGWLYLAGERVPPGVYKLLGGAQVIRLDREDYLPASLDGRVACYQQVQNMWGQIQRPEREEPSSPRSSGVLATGRREG